MFTLPILAEWLWWQLGGPIWTDWLSYWFDAPIFAYVMAIPISLVLLVPKSTRAHAAAAALCCLFALLASIAGHHYAEDTRQWGLEQTLQRSQGIVDAIHSFAEKSGSAPDSLQDLVPALLPDLPNTGLVQDPNYEYKPGVHGQQHWTLAVRINRRASRSGVLIYNSSELYPHRADGYSYQKIDRWALRLKHEPTPQLSEQHWSLQN
ncbi:MAG: hypothetical protein P1V35_14130 [Planctomycetota bacterium]|nr:hypothetical protein [Planctomycetota bacterium]